MGRFAWAGLDGWYVCAYMQEFYAHVKGTASVRVKVAHSRYMRGRCVPVQNTICVLNYVCDERTVIKAGVVFHVDTVAYHVLAVFSIGYKDVPARRRCGMSTGLFPFVANC